MSGWSIDPTGVAGVLKDVSTHAEALGDTLKGLQDAVTAAVTATASGAVGEAMQGYFGMEGPRIEGMNTRITASCNGVVNAAQAYVKGDEEMAARAQQESINTVYPPQLPRGVV